MSRVVSLVDMPVHDACARAMGGLDVAVGGEVDCHGSALLAEISHLLLFTFVPLGNRAGAVPGDFIRIKLPMCRRAVNGQNHSRLVIRYVVAYIEHLYHAL